MPFDSWRAPKPAKHEPFTITIDSRQIAELHSNIIQTLYLNHPTWTSRKIHTESRLKLDESLRRFTSQVEAAWDALASD